MTSDEAPSTKTLAEQLAAEIVGEDGAAPGRWHEQLATADADALPGAAREVMRTSLLRMASLDATVPGSTSTYDAACDEARMRWAGAAASDERAALVSGLLGVIQLNARLVDAGRQGAPPRSDDELSKKNRDLVKNPEVQRALRLVYADPGDHAGSPWWSLDPQSFEYLSHGSTSFVVSARASLYPAPLAVKFLLLPYGEFPAIRAATAQYAGIPNDVQSTVTAYSHGSLWIIMELVSWPPLSATIAMMTAPAPTNGPGGGDPQRVELPEAAQLGAALLIALGELAQAAAPGGATAVATLEPHQQHWDLTPDNVFARLDSTGANRHVLVQLFDAGANPLSRTIFSPVLTQRHYIAPEVRSGGGSSTADVYSVGVILLRLLVPGEDDTRVALTRLYEISPVLGRFVDDMTDEDPEQRLRLQEHGRATTYPQVAAAWQRSVEQAEEEPAFLTPARKAWTAKLAPASREYLTLWNKIGGWAAVADILRWLPGRRDPRPEPSPTTEPYLKYLYLGSLVSTVVWAVVTAMALKGLGVVDLLDLTRGEVTWPVLTGPEGEVFAASLIALSQGLVASKYYQTIVARITLRGTDVPGKWLTEILIRCSGLVALPTALVAFYGPASQWALWCAVGAFYYTALNYALLRVAQYAKVPRQKADQKVRLRGRPKVQKDDLNGFGGWPVSMFVYAVLLSVIAAGLQVDGFAIGPQPVPGLRDTWAYVLGLVLVTVAIHYVSKCAIAGPGVRAGLSQAVVELERRRRPAAPLPEETSTRRQHPPIPA